MASIQFLKDLARLAQLDFDSACSKAPELLTPSPLSGCRINYIDRDHQEQLLGQAGCSQSPYQKLDSFAAGRVQLHGTPTHWPLDEEARAILDAVKSVLTNLWKQRQLGKRLVYNGQRWQTSDKIRAGLVQLSELVYQAQDLRAFYHGLHQVLRGILSADNLVIAVADRQAGTFSYVYAQDTCLTGKLEEGTVHPIERLKSNLSGLVFRRQKATLIYGRGLREMLKYRARHQVGEVPTSWLGVPFDIDSDRRGILILQTYQGDPRYQESDRQLLESVSQHISTANRRYQAESHLKYQVNHDLLTGLANRQHLTQQLKLSLDEGRATAVLFIDLDNFKQLNDRFGHSAGDHFLLTQARRIQEHLIGIGTAGRLGGDEFAVVLSDHSDAMLAQLADQLCQLLVETVTWQHQPLQGEVSIGIASCGVGQTISAEQLLIQADHAMYRAKQQRGSFWRRYDAALEQELESQQWLLLELEQALGEGALHLHYQPIIETANGSIRAFEALLRWDHPQRGPIGPGEFISLAEESGLIIALDRWVLEQACQQLRNWLDLGYAIRISVNVSSRHFSDPQFAEHVTELVRRYRLPRHSLLVELTEHALVSQFDQARDTINQLSQAGIRLALDDFGTGFSSLSYINSLPFDVLKIDRCFIQGLPDNRTSTRIVSTIISLAHAIGMVAIAEGVETDAQRASLRVLGCDRLQGFLIARPMPAEQAQALLQTEPRLQQAG